MSDRSEKASSGSSEQRRDRLTAGVQTDPENRDLTKVVRTAAKDPKLAKVRMSLAEFTASSFIDAGNELHAVGHLFGPDRVNGQSPGAHGSDEIVAVSLLLRIGGELVAAVASLYAEEKHYAAAALVRQVVEIEYLAWAFEARDGDAEKWLRSTREERESFFSPRKLRAASNGRFRGRDYGHHCELGGHPVPGSFVLLKNDVVLSQLILSDLLGHTGRIWDHVCKWSAGNVWAERPIGHRRESMSRRYSAWNQADDLTRLRPFP